MNYVRQRTYRSAIAVLALIPLILVYVGKVHELIPGAEKLNVAKFAIVLALVLYFAMPKKSGAALLSYSPVRYVLGILLMVLLSIPFSAYSGGSVSFLTGAFWKNLVFFFLVAAIVDVSADFEKIAFAVVAAVFSLSVAFLLLDSGIRAYVSNTYDKNDTAFVLVTFLPLVYFWMRSMAGPTKLILFGVVIAMLLALLKTVSRGGLVGLCIVGIAIYVKQGKSLRQLFIPLLVVATVISMFATQGFWDKMSTMTDPNADYNMTASSGRVAIWKRGLTMMATHIFGVGAGAFEVAEGRMHEGRGKWSSPHNSFIQIGAELGVVGLYMFVMLMVSSLQYIRECRDRDADGVVVPHWLLDGLEVSFYGYVATGFFLSQAYSVVLYLLVAMVVSARRIIDREVLPTALPESPEVRVL